MMTGDIFLNLKFYIVNIFIVKRIFKDIPKVQILKNDSIFSKFQLILITISGIYLYAAIIFIVVELTKTANIWPDIINDSRINLYMVLLVIITSIIAPVFEEYIFRRLIQDSLSKYGRYFAFIVTALLFAFMHFGRFYIAIFMGIINGILYMLSGSVLYPILMHIAINTGIYEYPIKIIAKYFLQEDVRVMDNLLLSGSISFFIFILFSVVFIIISNKQVKDFIYLNPLGRKDIMKSNFITFFKSEKMLILISLFLLVTFHK